jgi:hypothetical protein
MTISILGWSLPIDCSSSTAWLDSLDHMPTSHWMPRMGKRATLRHGKGDLSHLAIVKILPSFTHTKTIKGVELCKRSGTFIKVPPPARLDWASVPLSRHLSSFPLPLYRSQKKYKKTYNSRYSLVVTHLTTNPPVRCLNRAERTGSLVFNVLWSYVEDMSLVEKYNLIAHKIIVSRATTMRVVNFSVYSIVQDANYFPRKREVSADHHSLHSAS